MARMKQKLLKIRKQLEEKSENNKITEDQLIQAIKDNAGLSRRTRERYKQLIFEEQILKPVEGEEKLEINKKLSEDYQQKVDHTADKKHVTLSVNKDLLNKLDQLGINKSNFFEKEAMKEFSTIKDEILERAAQLEDEEDAEFVQDLVLENCYKAGVNEQERRKIYLDHFGAPYNDFACEELRKTAFKIAEELGMIDRPKGL